MRWDEAFVRWKKAYPERWIAPTREILPSLPANILDIFANILDILANSSDILADSGAIVAGRRARHVGRRPETPGTSDTFPTERARPFLTRGEQAQPCSCHLFSGVQRRSGGLETRGGLVAD